MVFGKVGPKLDLAHITTLCEALREGWAALRIIESPRNKAIGRIDLHSPHAGFFVVADASHVAVMSAFKRVYRLFPSPRPALVVYVAHTFRNLPTPVRAGAMVSSMIGIISIFIYSSTVQNIFLDQLNALQTLANSGSEPAKEFLSNNEIALTGEITPPFS